MPAVATSSELHLHCRLALFEEARCGDELRPSTALSPRHHGPRTRRPQRRRGPAHAVIGGGIWELGGAVAVRPRCKAKATVPAAEGDEDLDTTMSRRGPRSPVCGVHVAGGLDRLLI